MTFFEEPAPVSHSGLTFRDASHAILWMLSVNILLSLALAGLDWPESTRGIVGSILLEAGLLAGALSILHRRRADWRTLFGLQSARFDRALAAGLAGCMIIIPVAAILGGISAEAARRCGLPVEAQPFIQWLQERRDLPFRIAFYLQAILVAPFVEELFFRGILLNSLLARWRFPYAVLASSLLFAACHFHLPGLLPLFAIATGFAAAYRVARSLAACWIMHAAYNIANIALMMIGKELP